MMDIILGGGITGRLAKQLFPDAVVLERKSKRKSDNLTRMWGTNYLWEPIPGNRCFSFQVLTHVNGATPTAEGIHNYKQKVNRGEGGHNWGLQFKEKTTGYDFFNVPDVAMHHGVVAEKLDLDKKILITSGGDFTYDRIISTIPLPYLAELIGLCTKTPEGTYCDFPSAPIYVTVSGEPSTKDPGHRGMYVNYITDSTNRTYRECYRGLLWHRESLLPAEKAIPVFPGKIYPSKMAGPLVSELRNRNVFCFGRYASWTENELVHQTWKKLWWFKQGRIKG